MAKIKSNLAFLIKKQIEDIRRERTKERIDSDFTELVQCECIDKVLASFPEKDRLEIEFQIYSTYMEQMGLKPSLSLRYLTTREGFDRMSYSIFRAFLANTDPQGRSQRELALTDTIGSKIYRWMDISNEVTLPKPDYSFIPQDMKKICDKFAQSGYYTKADVLTCETGLEFNPDLLSEGKSTRLAYTMEDAAIVPSAQQLRKEYNSSCQHFSSRTLQSYLRSVNLFGREVNFDVGEHSNRRVLEKWELSPMAVKNG